MQIHWNRWGAIVLALAGALCMAPALAKPAHPAAHKTTKKPPAHSVHAHKAPVRHAAPTAAKGARAPVHAKPGAARKAVPHHVVAAQRPAHRGAVRVQRKPVAAQRPAARSVVGKKPSHATAQRIRPGTPRASAKAHGAAPAQRVVRKTPPQRTRHKKTAH